MTQGESGAKRGRVRGHSDNANSALSVAIQEQVKLWRRHHLTYDQTKRVVEAARSLLDGGALIEPG